VEMVAMVVKGHQPRDLATMHPASYILNS
jgi:hypothetical protein